MATAAALSLELCQRVWDVFGFIDPDGVKMRRFVWTDYKPGNPMEIPLIEQIGEDSIALFPTLEEELARTSWCGRENGFGAHLRADGQASPQDLRRSKAPRDMKFAEFQHGGSTELDDEGIADIRPITGHGQLNTTAIYNKLSKAKAAQAASRRLQ